MVDRQWHDRRGASVPGPCCCLVQIKEDSSEVSAMLEDIIYQYAISREIYQYATILLSIKYPFHASPISETNIHFVFRINAKVLNTTLVDGVHGHVGGGRHQHKAKESKLKKKKL